MRHHLLASTALTASTAVMAGAAWAADLPVKAPPPPIKAPFSWNGCYVGLNAGWASSQFQHDRDIPGVSIFLVTRELNFDSSGRDSSFTGGGQIGCNWQFDPKWVLGLEGDINYLNGNRNENFSFPFAGHGEDTVVGAQQTSLRWLGTFRGRFGYTWDRWFLYATGGLAVGDVKSSVSATALSRTGISLSQYAGSYSADRVGWTVGAGFEYAFAERLSAKIEYLHFDLGNAGYSVVGTNQFLFPLWNVSAKVSGDIVRVGLNYRFVP
jgi:outer membrane immunogenic protein